MGVSGLAWGGAGDCAHPVEHIIDQEVVATRTAIPTTDLFDATMASWLRANGIRVSRFVES
jgi:hypothetical protein